MLCKGFYDVNKIDTRTCTGVARVCTGVFEKSKCYGRPYVYWRCPGS